MDVLSTGSDSLNERNGTIQIRNQRDVRCHSFRHCPHGNVTVYQDLYLGRRRPDGIVEGIFTISRVATLCRRF